MAVPLCYRCNLPIFLPPGYVGALCPCRVGLLPSTGPVGAPTPPAPPFSDALLVQGGRRQGDVASGSPGRGPEKGSQRSPGGQKQPIPAMEVPKEAQEYEPTQDDYERVEGWFKAKFFVKGGITSAEFVKLISAAKGFGYDNQKDGALRDYLKSRWDAGGSAAKVVVRVLRAAEAIQSPKGG